MHATASNAHVLSPILFYLGIGIAIVSLQVKEIRASNWLEGVRIFTRVTSILLLWPLVFLLDELKNML